MQQRTVEDQLFDPGEAEAMAKEARRHLRAAEEAGARGADATQRREEAAANEVLDKLLQRLRPRLARYAEGPFRNRPNYPDQEILEVAVQEMALGILRRLRDPKQGDIFERKFNYAAKFAILDAIKKVRRENGTDENGLLKDGQKRVDWEGGAESEEGTVRLSLASRTEDLQSPVELAGVIHQVALPQLLEKLPTPLHAQLVSDYLQGLRLKEIAARAGICGKTATRYIKQAFYVIRKLMTEPEGEQRRESP